MSKTNQQDYDFNQAKQEFEQEVEQLVGKKEYRDFKKFAFKKSMSEMAIAFMLGGAFQKVVGSISANLIMPCINFVIDQTGTNWREHVFVPVEGLSLEVGSFLGAFVDFLLIAIVLYILYKKVLNPIIKEDKISCVNTIECPQCVSRISYRCKRCPNCTSEVKL